MTLKEINDLDLGTEVGDRKLSLLLYADDIVLMSDTETKLQAMLNTVDTWCRKWRVVINTDKSKCMHFRRPRMPQSDYIFVVGEHELETVNSYKYLGVIFEDKGGFKTNCDLLSKAAGRALESCLDSET